MPWLSDSRVGNNNVVDQSSLGCSVGCETVRYRDADGAQERVAAGQDVPAVRRDEEEPRGYGLGAARGRLRVWSLHGGRALGRAIGHDRRVATQRTSTAHARHLHQGNRGPFTY